MSLAANTKKQPQGDGVVEESLNLVAGARNQLYLLFAARNLIAF